MLCSLLKLYVSVCGIFNYNSQNNETVAISTLHNNINITIYNNPDIMACFDPPINTIVKTTIFSNTMKQYDTTTGTNYLIYDNHIPLFNLFNKLSNTISSINRIQKPIPSQSLRIKLIHSSSNINTQNSTFQNPTVQNPSIQNPTLNNPSIQNPSIQNPTVNNPGIQSPSIQNPSIQNPTTQTPTTQTPTTQKPTTQKPTTQKPTTEKPTQKPTTQKPRQNLNSETFNHNDENDDEDDDEEDDDEDN